MAPSLSTDEIEPAPGPMPHDLPPQSQQQQKQRQYYPSLSPPDCMLYADAPYSPLRGEQRSAWPDQEGDHDDYYDDFAAGLQMPGPSSLPSTLVASATSSHHEKLRLAELEHDARMAGAELPRRSTAGMFKNVCSTDLLFLIDTTASMAGHIKAAKDQVRSIVSDITAAFLNEAKVRIAVVAYKDHKDNPTIQFLDFTPSVHRVRLFLNRLSATGGGDTPEDVLGGLRRALHASWRQQTRCIIHIADSPAHGTALHDEAASRDDYPVPGTEPHRLTHEPLLKQMIGLSINYAFLRITSLTDRMVFTFAKAYALASADCKLNRKNRYYSQWDTTPEVSGVGGAGSKLSAKAGLQFVEAELGTTYSALRHLVVRSVVSSASRTAVRLSASAGGAGGAAKKKLDMNLAAIEEDEDAEDEVPAKMETVVPQWDAPGWLNETLTVEGFSPDVVSSSGSGANSSLDDMMAHDDNIKMSITQLTIRKRSRPFAEGATRVAFYAATAASTDRFVVKSFKKGGKRLAHLAEDMRCQALCKAFALEFNALLSSSSSSSSGPGQASEKEKEDGKEMHQQDQAIDFIVTTCLKGRLSSSSGEGKGSAGNGGSDDADADADADDANNDEDDAAQCLSLEPFISGTYVKYNNNCGYVNDTFSRESSGDESDSNAEPSEDERFNRSAQAFSHFTFERSRGRFLVTDLQGVGRVLTDPAIHTLDPERFKLSETNLGREGFKFFFATHECNDVCRGLGLKSSAATIGALGSWSLGLGSTAASAAASTSTLGKRMFGRKGGNSRQGETTAAASAAAAAHFRQSWPSARLNDKTVACCSNKLCGRILRLNANQRTSWGQPFSWPFSSEEKNNSGGCIRERPYLARGYNWCAACWPQLEASTVRTLCLATTSTTAAAATTTATATTDTTILEEKKLQNRHEFEVSTFFYESQGHRAPRKCPAHRRHARDRAVAAAADDDDDADETELDPAAADAVDDEKAGARRRGRWSSSSKKTTTVGGKEIARRRFWRRLKAARLIRGRDHAAGGDKKGGKGGGGGGKKGSEGRKWASFWRGLNCFK